MRRTDVEFAGILAGVLVLAALAGSACERDAEEASDAGGKAPDKVVADQLPDSPERIVTMGPNVTETVFALGAGDRVVAVSKFSDYPDEVAELPQVGSFRNPNIESILAEEPDLVVGTVSGGDADLDEKLASAGVPYAFAKMGTIEEALRGMRWIGGWLGLEERGDELAERVERELETIAGRHADRGAPRVLMVHGHEPIVAAGPGSLGHQLVVRAGGRNALDEGAADYPRLDVEKVMAIDPDRIVDTSTWSEERRGDYWSQFGELGAVESGGVRYLDDPVVLRAGPRLPTGLQKVARAIHGTDETGTGGTDDAEDRDTELSREEQAENEADAGPSGGEEEADPGGARP